ncbi:YesL family protein [Cohnella thailandensis]|jgi:Predicted integral membrane protein|uniref:DUF624 domain-containing protein n=1 Tax=Cohnella thailandensis TaxID=557557 RepID=A0A841STS7_9BACL|nr:DUF624 domain-containing protein [Cohnella thailandensis]MBB6633996.1 DUF624 domain-containing protein [Cohnella thailandensis]MBP1972681.1 putative membrane protein YesL [Cohnella thailandensis]
MEMRGMMGGFYKISEWIMRLSVTNVLWVVCSIPVFFFALTALLTSETTGQLVANVIIISILSPFTLFPATSAMFSVARKWVMGDTDVPLFKTFFRSYKQNYVQAMLGGIIYAVLFAILIVDYQVYLKDLKGFGVLAILFLALMVLLFISLFQFFSLLSHFHMKTMQLIKNAVILTIGRPLRSLSTAVVSGFILYISVFKFTFLIPFFMGSVIAVFAFFNFYQTIQKMQAKNAAAEEDGEALPIEDSPTKDDEEIK